MSHHPSEVLNLGQVPWDCTTLFSNLSNQMLAFPAARSVELDLHQIVSVNHPDLHCMLAAWPNLTRLHILYSPPHARAVLYSRRARDHRSPFSSLRVPLRDSSDRLPRPSFGARRLQCRPRTEETGVPRLAKQRPRRSPRDRVGYGRVVISQSTMGRWRDEHEASAIALRRTRDQGSF